MTGKSDMKFKHLILVLLGTAFASLQAQDFHHSFHQFAPMTVSPTLTGAFYGNVRASVLGRDQGRTVAGAGHEWQDLSLSVDYNIDMSLTEGDWVSVGMNFVRSAAVGAGNLRRQFMGVSAAYHLAFGKKLDKVFTAGIKYGPYSKYFNNVNLPDYSSPFSVANNNTPGTDLTSWYTQQFGQVDVAKKSSNDYAIGLMLDVPLGKTSDLRFGVSSDHLLRPRLSTPGTRDTTGTGMPPIDPTRLQQEFLDRRINVFAFLYTDINKRMMFNPTLVVQKKGVTTNILTQFLFTYLYNQEKGVSLIAGLGARFANSMDIPLYLALDMKDLRIGLSYDTNVSGLRPTSNTFGAVELAVTKIFNWNKKVVVDPVFICPRL